MDYPQSDLVVTERAAQTAWMLADGAKMTTVEAIHHDLAATCGAAAEDPLNLPTLDACGRMELADVIKTTKMGGHTTGGGGEIWLY